jgi:hypothetical protein
MVEFKGDKENGFSKRTLDGGWEDIKDEGN